MSNAVEMSTIQAVLDAFSDPETGRSITKLEQVHDVKLDDGNLSFNLGLTTFSAAIWEEVRQDLEKKLRDAAPGLANIDITISEHYRAPIELGEIRLTAKAVIAVGSGKGGVGKSTMSASLAYGLKNAGCKVGLMDADVYGPSIPHLLGVEGQPHVEDNRIQPVEKDGMKVMSMGFMVPPGEAVVWRGPMLHQAMTQFLRDTAWGELDYLIIDMPPGTGDIALSLSQLLPLTGAVVVCTPQEVALLDAIKAIAMFGKVNIPVLGMIENMSYFECPDTKKRYPIFGEGGARKKAAELDVPFLGEVPINIQMRIQGDEGRVGQGFDDEYSRPFLNELCTNLVRTIVSQHAKQPPMPTLSVVK